MPSNIYRQHLERNRANFAPLTPLSFLQRSAAVYPKKTAVVHGERRFSYAEFRERCHRHGGLRNVGEYDDRFFLQKDSAPVIIAPHSPTTGISRGAAEQSAQHS